MSELEDIKARAAERTLTSTASWGVVQQLMADLDRAIAIAEGTQEAFNLMMDERVNVATGREKELEQQLEQARADLVRLLDEAEGMDDLIHQDRGVGPYEMAGLLLELQHYRGTS